MWEQQIGNFPVDFEKQGDEWAHHLAIELGDWLLPSRGPTARARWKSGRR